MNPAWIFIIVGALLLGYGACLTALGAFSSSWPSVRGTLESVVVEKGGTGMGFSARADSFRVRYSYTVDAKIHHGGRIAFGGPGRAEIREIESNEELTVWYCPWAPGISVLIPGVRRSSLLFMGGGLVFLHPLLLQSSA